MFNRCCIYLLLELAYSEMDLPQKMNKILPGNVLQEGKKTSMEFERKYLPCKRFSSWLTNDGETVDERIIDAPDGRAINTRGDG